MTLSISPQEFFMLRKYIEEQCGIFLGDNKAYLIENRLSNLARENGCSSFGDFYHKVRNTGRSEALRDAIVDAISTNETLWFRDGYPFRILRDFIIPVFMREVDEGRRERIAIWSAACSTGQEPYSIAMTVLNSYAEAGRREECLRRVRITASDVSHTSLAVAEKGFYLESAMKRGMIPMYRHGYFRKQGDHWRISDEVREMVSFKQYNLKDPPPGTFGSFDLVFLRNVIIYFSDEFKRSLFAKVARLMSPRGYLFLGTGETTDNYTEAFDVMRVNGNTFYRVRA